ncbi:MAG: hypothetical protein AAFO04_00290 [Cyanobacteria bacterium J06592_8]
MRKIRQVPMMFRAQVEGRCQIQRVGEQAEDWTQEWIDGADRNVPKFRENVRTREYAITWRFVTNSGQDEGVIRPVIGANGCPFYPGSSMKGAFLRVCPLEKQLEYCGDNIGNETKPGILRFHGGYPKNQTWREQNLVDIVHPQEGWQVKANNAKHSAFTQISLYKPRLVFGISSTKELKDSEWEEIWKIWENALGRGIGSRVSAGYGQPKINTENTALTVYLKGQGLASQLVNKTGEFRPNMFKAALRGHTLRLLGGVTDSSTAEFLTKQLWGGFNGQKGAIVGQLGIRFDAINLEMDDFTYSPGQNPIEMPIYDLQKGKLDVVYMQNLSDGEQKNLRVFVTKLIKFSVLLGGFGKSWRRVDHRLFYPDYLTKRNKPMIGCHWELLKQSQNLRCPVNDLSEISDFLNGLHSRMKQWVKLNQKMVNVKGSDWREAWHPKRVQVWGRIADNAFESDAIGWFHGNYQEKKRIKNTDLTGEVSKNNTKIGRIWHRMYPRYILNGKKLNETKEYVELLTIFPDESETTDHFLEFLDKRSDFQLLWPNH